MSEYLKIAEHHLAHTDELRFTNAEAAFGALMDTVKTLMLAVDRLEKKVEGRH